MATYWTHRCGCRVSDGTTGPDREETIGRDCLDCRTARLGERIRFVRFGHLPESGTSTNHRDRVAEDGVSVYEVRDGKADLVGWYFDFLSRPAYRGVGKVVGWGSDGEPLVKVESARRVYGAALKTLL
jgi:hypothetical protein